MSVELILFFCASILPIFYTLNVGGFLYEDKRYLTNIWRLILFNFWFPIIGLLFLLSFSLFIDPKLEIIIFPMCYYFLLIYNIFIIWKILRGKLQKTKYRKYVYLWMVLIWIEIYFIVYFFWNQYLSSYILLILFLNHIIFLPLKLRDK